jgi:hypothetical protein
VAAVAATGGEDVYVPLTARAGAQRALQKIVLIPPAENPNASAHADQGCPPTPAIGKLITPIVARLISTFYGP